MKRTVMLNKKKILLRIILSVVIAVLLVGGLLALRSYRQPFVLAERFTVCDQNGKTYEMETELYVRRWLLAPTDVVGAVTVDGVRYTTFWFPRAEESGRIEPFFEKPQNGFWKNIKAKWQELQSGVVMLAYDGGSTDRVYFSTEVLFAGDPFAESSEEIWLNGLAVDDDWNITGIWFAGNRVFGSELFGPSATADENEQVKTEVFGITIAFAK